MTIRLVFMAPPPLPFFPPPAIPFLGAAGEILPGDLLERQVCLPAHHFPIIPRKGPDQRRNRLRHFQLSQGIGGRRANVGVGIAEFLRDPGKLGEIPQFGHPFQSLESDRGVRVVQPFHKDPERPPIPETLEGGQGAIADEPVGVGGGGAQFGKEGKVVHLGRRRRAPAFFVRILVGQRRFHRLLQGGAPGAVLLLPPASGQKEENRQQASHRGRVEADQTRGKGKDV
ncbi:MAG: hypothetical protein NTV79_11700 [Candidatus Aureabacteria bacterium]|nr:hypothetical protein [Candidatus Auribacterota bacterium]